MARVDDRKGAKEREKVKVRELADAGEITESDADAILELAAAEEGDKADSTIRNHLLQSRVTAQRADTPLLEMDNDDVDAVLAAMKSGRHPDVPDDGITVRGYQGTLRVFYRYHDTAVDPDEIEMEEAQGRDLNAEDLLYEAEVEALLNAARRASIRDMAFLALALATGQRIDAIRTLRLKHVTVDGPTMEVQLNTEEGALKGASGTKPLLWAKHYVRPWYESHPYKDDPEAALFCIDHRTADDPREPMSDDAIRTMVRRRAEEAGIDKEIYPHLLRHTAITRMVIEGLSEQKIKRIVGWSPDSSQFATYVHLADDLEADSVRDELGLPTSDSGIPAIGAPPLDECPDCHDQIPEGKERCPTCKTAMTHREAEEGGPVGDRADKQIREGYREAEDMETVEKVQLLDDLLDDPEVRALLQDRMN